MTGTERDDDHNNVDDNNDEVDPTGVRALLSALPDPGPMPPELVARIGASLEAEQQARAENDPATGWNPNPSGDNVVSFTEERRRRRPARTITLLAGAAAVAVAATIAVAQNLQLDGPEVVHDAAPPAESDADEAPDDMDDHAGEPAPAPEEEDNDGIAPSDDLPPPMGIRPSDEEGEAEPIGPDGQTLVDLIPGVVDLTSPGFDSQVGDWYTDRNLPAREPEPELEFDAIDGLTCAESIDHVEPSYLAVSAATFDGQDAVLLVQGRPAPRAAWVLPLDCVNGPTEVLYGPVDFE